MLIKNGAQSIKPQILTCERYNKHPSHFYKGSPQTDFPIKKFNAAPTLLPFIDAGV